MPDNTENLVKRRVHLYIFAEDDDFLEEHFGRTTKKSAAARAMIHNAIVMLKAKAEQRARVITETDEELKDGGV